MRFLPMNRLFWHVRRYASDFGWPGAVAMLLFAASAAFVFLSLTPVRDRVAALQRDAKNLRLQSKASAPREKALNPAEQLGEFYRFFPRQESVPDGMAALYNAAAQHNLNLEQAEYRLAHDRDGKLTRYEVVLPVKGGYVQLRKFIAQVLADVPSLSLDSVTFNRQKIGDDGVDAQLKLTFYLGAQ